jgi:serine/threonine protein kinase
MKRQTPAINHKACQIRPLSLDKNSPAYADEKRDRRQIAVTPDGYAVLKAQVDMLQAAFPDAQKFSRQHEYQVLFDDGSEQRIVLNASVFIDSGKPDDFVVLGDLLDAGGFARIKDSWSHQADGMHCDVEKIIDTRKQQKKLRVYEKQAAREVDLNNMIDGKGSSRLLMHANGKFYLSMRKRLGGTLLDWINRSRCKPLAFNERLSIMRGIHEGLANIHEKNYIHGDVKPENIMLHQSRNGLWCVEFIDYEFSLEMESKTKAMGTPYYMHPDLRHRRSRLAGQWIDAHAIAGIFAKLLEKDGGKHCFSKKVEADPRGYEQMVLQPYVFEGIDFYEDVPSQCQPLLSCLLKYLEGRKFNAPTDKQIAVCLNVLDDFVKQNNRRLSKSSRKKLELEIAEFDKDNQMPELKEALDELDELTLQSRSSFSLGSCFSCWAPMLKTKCADSAKPATQATPLLPQQSS